MEIEFVTPTQELVKQLCASECHKLSQFMARFRRTTLGHEYEYPVPVRICDVFSGKTQIRNAVSKKERQREKSIPKIVNKWCITLISMKISLSHPLLELIEQLQHFDDTPVKFRTRFRRTTPGREYTHPMPVRIDCVLCGTVKIWSDDEKKAYLKIVNVTYHPRGN